MGRQHQKDDATTVVATAAINVNRFVSHSGKHATSAGGVMDSLGVSEFNAGIGDAVSVVTEFSYLVESSGPLNEHDFVRPAADGSGRAETGTATDHCGRVMPGSNATQAGQLVEVRILPHRHV